MTRERIKRLPGVRGVLPVWHRWRALARCPGVGICAARTRLSRVPLVLFYCDQISHRQTVQELLVALHAQAAGRVQLVVLNGFDHRSRTAELCLPGVMEFAEAGAGVLRSFRPALLVTPCVGFRRKLVARGTPILHLLVSLTSLDGVYHESHFDDYDYVVCAGEHQVRSFREWRARRAALAGKTLIPGGYPKLDLQLRQMALGKAATPKPRTVVYAPTHVYEVNEALASLRSHGAEIVRTLLQAGWRVVFRPHPVSWTDQEKDLVAGIVAEHRENPGFELDRAASYQAAYASSEAMVTDLSGTGFTYAFTFGRPVVFFAANAAGEAGLTGLQYEGRAAIGQVARSLPEMLTALTEFQVGRDELCRRIGEFRSRTIYNLLTSGDYLARAIGDILARRPQLEWIQL